MGWQALVEGAKPDDKRGRAEVCFERVDREELTVGGVKVAGVALARVRRAALVQTAVPLVPAPPELASFVADWDAARPAAARVLAGLEEGALHRAMVAALARSECFEWPAGWREAADQESRSARADGEQR